VRRDICKRRRSGTERQRSRHDDKTHGLVQDDRFKTREAISADEQREAKFCAAESDEAAERPDYGAATERGRGAPDVSGQRR